MPKESIPVSPEVMEAYSLHSQQFGLLPIKVSPHYRALVREEVDAIGPGGPLYRNVYPEQERLKLNAPFEVPDFVTDKENMHEGAEHAYIQKYDNRILMLTTERCFSNCQYCFRTDLLSEEAMLALPSFDQKTELVAEAVHSDPAIKEVILSGGDPLIISHRGLRRLFSNIRSQRSDISFRVHTRAIAFAPQVIGEEMSDLLGEYDVRTYFHITHPYEITADQRNAFERLRSRSVRMYNQSPIIRGVNDHEAVLERLVTNLEDEHVRPISFFIADPIEYSADFRVPLKHLFGITDTLRWKLPSWSSTFRLVLDTPVGKVRREDITSWDSGTDTVIFNREGDEVVYHDLPESMYVPGDINIMLWKGEDCGERPRVGSFT